MGNKAFTVKSVGSTETRDYTSLRDHYRALEVSYEQLIVKVLLVGGGASLVALLTFVSASTDSIALLLSLKYCFLGFTLCILSAGLVPMFTANYYSNLTSQQNNLASGQSFEQSALQSLRQLESADDPLAKLKGQVAAMKSRSKSYYKQAEKDRQEAESAQRLARSALMAACVFFCSSLLYPTMRLIFVGKL